MGHVWKTIRPGSLWAHTMAGSATDLKAISQMNNPKQNIIPKFAATLTDVIGAQLVPLFGQLIPIDGRPYTSQWNVQFAARRVQRFLYAPLPLNLSLLQIAQVGCLYVRN